MYTNKIRYNIYETDINILTMLMSNNSNVFEYTINGNRILGSLTSFRLAELSTNLLIPYDLRKMDDNDSVITDDDMPLHKYMNDLDLSKELIDEIAEYTKNKADNNIKVSQQLLDDVIDIYVKHGYDIPGLTSDIPEYMNIELYFKEAIDICELYGILVTTATRLAPMTEEVAKAAETGKVAHINRLNSKYNKLVYDKNYYIDEHVKFSYGGYIINADGTLGDIISGFRTSMDKIGAEIIYYPDLKIAIPDKIELPYYIIDTHRGVDLFKRDHATMIVDRQYIIGMKSKYKGLEDNGDFIFTRDSTVHTGLLWSYLLQSKSPLEEDGYRRHMIDDLIANHEDHILFGELTDGIHIMEVEYHYTRANGLDYMTKEEILQYFKNIIGENEKFKLNVCIKNNMHLNKYGEYMVIGTIEDKLIIKKEMK